MALASTPVLYWYPEPTGTLEAIQLGSVSELDSDPTRVTAESESLSGRSQVIDYGGGTRVRFVRSPWADPTGALRRDLQSLDRHLQSGGRVGLSLRQDKAWAVWGTRYILRGNTAVQHTGVGMWEPTATLASGDEVVITSANPERTEEAVTISAATSSSVTLSESARYSHKATPVLLRYADYWPVMRLSREARGRSIVQDLGWRHTFELTLDLVEDTAALWSLAARGGAAFRGATASSLPSLEQAIRPPAPSSVQRSTTTTVRRF